MATKSIDLHRLISLSRSLKHLKPLYSLITVHGLESHQNLNKEFLRSCLELNLPYLALLAFRRSENPSLASKSLLIRHLGKYGLYDDVLQIFSRSRNSSFTIPSAIKACSAIGTERIGREVHCVALRSGFENDVVVQTGFIDFYSKIGNIRNAQNLFDRVLHPDLVLWNVFIAGYSRNGLDRDAIEVFERFLGSDLRPNESTLASVIPVCSRLGLITIGESLHGYTLKSGYLVNGFLVPALISMYASDSDLRSVRNLFDSAVEKSVSVWNSLIFAYTQVKMHEEAFSAFNSMLGNDVRPDSITFASVIPFCENDKPFGESLHGSAIKLGFRNQAPVSIALMSMYAKLGDIGSADYIFNQMLFKTRLSWNSLISGYISNGLYESGLVLFRKMRFSGIEPDEVSVLGLISACAKLDAISLGELAHALTFKKGLTSTLHVANTLLAFYASWHKLVSCLKLFDEIPVRSIVSWNTLISCCVNNRDTAMTISVLRRMRKDEVEFDLVTLISLLPIITGSESLREGTAFHCRAVKYGYSVDISLVNALISMYCNCGDLDSGKFLFKDMPENDVVSYNALLTGFRDRGLWYDVFDLLGKMANDRKSPNLVTLLNILPCCYNILQGKSVHGFAIRNEIVRETVILTSLMFMYARFGNVGDSLALFRIGRKDEISLWNAKMSVLTQSKNPRRAIAVFFNLLRTGLEPDSFTAQSLISASVHLNSPKLADSVASFLIRKALNTETMIGNGLVDLYAKCGDIVAARKIFDRIVLKDRSSWSAMINGYGLHGNGRSALGLLSGVKPDGSVFSAILSACSHSGLAHEGLRIFKSMSENGVSPGLEHYAVTVDLLARTGNLNEAYTVMKAMSFEPSMGMLEAVLGGCVVYGNIEIGAEIAGRFLGLELGNSGIYAALHNVYASAGRWDDAERVRFEIDKRGLGKVPGFALLVEDGLR